MANYTEITLETAKDIMNMYGIESVESIEGISLGISNSNYRVKSEFDEFVLKVSNDKDLQQIGQEMQILNYLKEQIFLQCLKPFQLKDGQYVYQFKTYIGAVFPMARGEVPKIGLSTSDEMGRSLAKLHKKTFNIKVPKNIRNHNNVGHDLQSISAYCEQVDGVSYFIESFKECFQNRIKDYSDKNFPQGIIHGDFYFDNCIFRNGFLVAMLDFEQSGIGPFLFDIGVAISGSCLKNGQIDLGSSKAFIEGYHSHRPLNQDEKDHLCDAIMIGLFSIALWRIKRFTEGDLAPDKTDSYKELIDRAIHFHKSSFQPEDLI